jgi:hypothetical protein
MPQASRRQHELMEKWFGDPVSELGPCKLLEQRGYDLTRGYEWVKPTPSHTIHEIEWECIQFLIDEWDFGGVASAVQPAKPAT